MSLQLWCQKNNEKRVRCVKFKFKYLYFIVIKFYKLERSDTREYIKELYKGSVSLR